MRVFISAGEASGDAYGAALASEMRKSFQGDAVSLFDLFGKKVNDSDRLDALGAEDSLDVVEYVMQLEDEFGITIPDGDVPQLKTVGDLRDYVEGKVGTRPALESAPITFEGVGGPRMKAAGVRLCADSSKWGAISIAQAARVAFSAYTGLLDAKRHLKSGAPGLLIPIDFGFANIRLARYAKKKGWKVLYFVPPGSWRRDKQGKDLPEVADEIVTPFDWSADILRKMGASAHWFGHPIKQLIAVAKNERHKTATQYTIAVLPGSRTHELEMTLPLIAGAVSAVPGGWTGKNLVGISHEELTLPKPPISERLEFALAPSVDAQKFQLLWNQLAPGRDDIFTSGDTYGVLERGKVAIICSGTATLEAALCRCPMVVIYQLSPTMRREARLLRVKQPKFVSLPNIIQDREIVPELVDGEGVYPAEVRAWLDRLLTDHAVREKQLEELDSLVKALGPSDAITKTAELALRMLGK